MSAENNKLTAWELWQRCGRGTDRQAQKIFWSDIVLFMKNYPSKAGYFAELIKKVGISGYAGHPIAAPMPVIVKRLQKYEETFIESEWGEIISAWSKIKPELKIKAQTVILQRDGLVKKFLTALLTEVDNPREIIVQIVNESGLLPRYHKNDIILMLCSIIAESLEGQVREKEKTPEPEAEPVLEKEKEPDEDMDGEVFAVIDETAPAAVNRLPAEHGAGPATLLLADPGGDKAVLVMQECVVRLEGIEPLAGEWDNIEPFLAEIKNLAAKKANEKAEIIRRGKLLGEFDSKMSYLTDVFYSQLSGLGVRLPGREAGRALDNDRLSDCNDVLARLQNALAKYKEVSEKKGGNLAEEKNRVGVLLTVITEIEQLAQEVGVFIVLPKTSQQPAPPVRTAITADTESIKIVQQEILPEEPEAPEAPVAVEDAITDAAAAKAETAREEDAQMELFAGND